MVTTIIYEKTKLANKKCPGNKGGGSPPAVPGAHTIGQFFNFNGPHSDLVNFTDAIRIQPINDRLSLKSPLF